ncbi:MAG: hypothetical protein ABI575_04600 [Oxalobacteraceae bacterium]
MTVPSAASDEIEKLWLTWRESETILPPMHQVKASENAQEKWQNKGRHAADATPLQRENAPRRLSSLTQVQHNKVVELPVTAPNDVVAKQPDYSTGNQWILDPDNAESRLSENALPDNATDAIHATLSSLSERRPDLFGLASGDALDTTIQASVPVVQPTVLSNRGTQSTSATDPMRPEKIALQSEQADQIDKNRREQSPAQEWLAVSNNSLDDMRGGFDNGAGLLVSFGIERAVYINGNLTTSVSFNIPDVGKFAASQAQIAADQAKVVADQSRIVAEQAKVTADQARLAADQARITAVQVGAAAGQTAAAAATAAAQASAAAGQTAAAAARAGVAAGQTTAAAAQVGVAAGQTAAAAAPTGVAAAQAGLGEQVRIASEQARINSEQSRLSSEQAKINSEQARLTTEQAKIGSITGAAVNLIQNGPGNVFQPGPLPQTVAATVIQNTLDNQNIKSLTVINTAVNSLGVLKAINAQASLRDALGNSLGVR